MRNKLMSIANEVRESVFVVCHESHNGITKQALGFGTTEESCNAIRFGSLRWEINKELHRKLTRK